MKKIAILQSNYVPWRGYFDMIASVDEFILYDEVQFTKNDWRNRNIIRTATKNRWLTLPVKHRFGQRIDEVVVADDQWSAKHLTILKQCYSKAIGLRDMRSWLEEIYNEASSLTSLSQINRHFISKVCDQLGIETIISASLDYNVDGDRNEKLIELCKACGATTYVSGPAAQSYLETDRFDEAGIAVQWFEYGPYVAYSQTMEPYDPRVSILDLILNCGEVSSTVFNQHA